MRRLLPFLLALLLPLQWSGAAAAIRCLHGAGAAHASAGHGGVAPGHAAHDRAGGARVAHGHAAHGHASDGHAAHGHAAHGHATHGHAADGHAADGHAAHGHSAHERAAGVASGGEGELAPLAGLDDCAHAECGGCCHGGSLPAWVAPLTVPPAFGRAPAARAETSPGSPALAGPFRPPRTASA